MALAKVVASKPLTRLVSKFSHTETGAFSCFFSTKSWRETDCEYNYNLKIRGRSKSSIPRDLFNDAFCHRLPATRNLARLLNLMDRDHHIIIGTEPCGHPRWDVTQDAQALYLVYNMSGIPKKDDVNEFVDKDFQGSTCAFRHVRVSNDERMSEIILEETGPDPMATYQLYLIRLYLQDSCIVSDAKVDMGSEVLKITIPKKEGKWIHIINVEPNLFWPPKACPK